MKPLSLETVAQVVSGEIIGAKNLGKDIFISGVCADSRKVKSGDLFVPIKGERVDGHSFIKSAFEQGAICAFSEMVQTPMPESCYVIKVKSAQRALLALSEYYMAQFSTKVIAITGSVGKTTTKDMVASVISQKYKVLKTEGNYNTNVGLPLTVFGIDESTEVAVLEMGMNSFGEIHNLSKVARPDVAIITNIGVAHMEMLGSRDGILKAKSEIFDFMEKDGVAILHAGDDKLITLKDKLAQKIIWFGAKENAEIYADNVNAKDLDETICDIHTTIGTVTVSIPVPGAHMVLNALAAVSAGIEMGLTLNEIKKGIEVFKPTKMRMAVHREPGRITIINDVYNANPVSTKAALDVLSLAKGRRVCILGDMGELGNDEEGMHREVGKYAAGCGIDLIITIGDLAKYIGEAASSAGAENTYYYTTQEEFWQKGLQLLEIGDTVLVKASRSRGFEKTVEKIQGVN